MPNENLQTTNIIDTPLKPDCELQTFLSYEGGHFGYPAQGYVYKNKWHEHECAFKVHVVKVGN